MMRRAAALLLAPGLALAQPLPLPPPFVPPPELRRWGEAAPTPDRAIEEPFAVPRAGADLRPSLDPTFIIPRDTGANATIGRENPGQREDRLFQDPAPGLRLRVPFSD